MEPKQDYSTLLKDPRWQRKRLEIMQRDDFTCQHCGRKDRTLHIHHLVYDKSKKPWEYEDSNLLTLCENCHKCETEEYFELYETFTRLKNTFQRRGFSMTLLNTFLSQAEEVVSAKIFPKEMQDALKICIFGTQYLSDIRAAKRSGIDLRDLVEVVLPNFVEEYNSIAVEVSHE